MGHRIVAGILMLVSVILVSACGGVSAEKEPVEVKVTLTDYKIASSVTSFSKGQPYRFVITNEGRFPHELIIGQKSTGHAHQGAVLEVSQEKLNKGATATATVTFPNAVDEHQLEAACHLVGHYEQGMKLPLAVQ